MAKDRKTWGDPKWTMRRAFVISICVFCAFVFVLAMILPISPEKIEALSTLLGSIAVIVMPVIISYLGIAEAGQVIRDIRAQPGSTVTQTTEIKEVKPPPTDEVKPPKGEQL